MSQDKTQASKNFLHPYPPEGAFWHVAHWGPPGECGPISTQSALKLTCSSAELLAWHSRRPPECAAPGLQPRNTDMERYAFCPHGDLTQILGTGPDVKQLHMNCVVIYCWVHGIRLNCSTQHYSTQHSFAASTGCSGDSPPMISPQIHPLLYLFTFRPTPMSMPVCEIELWEVIMQCFDPSCIHPLCGFSYMCLPLIC